MIGNIVKLFKTIDREDGLFDKLTILGNWVLSLDLVEDVKLVFFDSNQSPPENNMLYTLPPKASPYLPEHPIASEESAGLLSILMLENTWKYNLVYIPYFNRHNELRGAILVNASKPSEFLDKHSNEFELLILKLKDMVDINNMERQAPDVTQLFKPDNLSDPHISSQLLESFNLPMYITDLSGKFSYVNTHFLEEYNYSSLDELNAIDNFFVNPKERTDEIEKLSNEGRVNGYKLTIRTGNGKILSARDSALFVGSQILGVLYDVTEFIQVNEELKEALEIQELLNDKLISSSLILQKTQTAAIKSLARLAEYRDRETGSHLQRICEYSGLISSEIIKRQPYSFKVAESYVNDMYISSMLHDIGKVGIPDNILLKEGKLTSQEWDVMKKHTTWGWSIMNQADKELGEQSFLTLAATIALHHHERYDGKGYPYGLSGEDIPLSARIEAVADVYDALTSKRPYKEAWSHEQAFEEIIDKTGQQFDPVIMDIVENVENKFKEIRERFPE